ncbi:MAG: GNAT family N-acetyltransferase [Lachnospiraceae bacterium]|nr:GNAT family N-acetyltransferase [Lachnospiraceae bacterium]
MKFQYITDRLILQVLDEMAAPLVLHFYETNKDCFDEWEPMRPASFYTVGYQRNVLEAEKKLFFTSSSVRYYLFEKTSPDKIIGSICFYQILKSPYNSCNLGYKIDTAHQHKGYAYEALSALIPEVFQTLRLYRIQADIMPKNTASIHLITRLGFTEEGLMRGCYEIHGTRTDHTRYALLATDPFVK